MKVAHGILFAMFLVSINFMATTSFLTKETKDINDAGYRSSAMETDDVSYRSSFPVREASDADYRTGRNTAAWIFREMDYMFANHYDNRTLIREKLLPIFQETYSSDAIVSLSYPPGLTKVSDPGPEGILQFAFDIITNKGEIHVFGQFLEWQILDTDDYFYKYPFLENPYIGIKRPVRLLFNSVNTDMIGLVEDNQHFREYRTEKTWIIDVEKCSILGDKRKAVIREIKMEILASVDHESAPPPAWQPINRVDPYVSGC